MPRLLRIRIEAFTSLATRSRQTCSMYCAICGVMLYSDEVAFAKLSVEEYRQMRPFYCSFLGSGTWLELVSRAQALQRPRSSIIMAPRNDAELDEFLLTIPSADPEADDPAVRLITCKRHQQYNDDLISIHGFYCNQLDPGHLVQGHALPEVPLSERSYLAPLMVYTELRRPAYVRVGNVPPVLSTLELSNRVIMYQSARFTDFAGTMGILLRRPVNVADREEPQLAEERLGILQEWWTFLVQNNALFDRYLDEHAQQPPLHEPPIVQQYGAMMEEEEFVPAEENGVQEEIAYLIPAAGAGLHDVGPWLDPTTQVIRVDVIAGNEVTLSNPDLFGLLFPWLFPFGRGFFKLSMAKARLRQAGTEEVDWPIFTLKAYAKHVLNSCDRRWALDVPFLAFLYDVLLKERLYSSSMRTVNPRTGGQPTAVHDVISK